MNSRNRVKDDVLIKLVKPTKDIEILLQAIGHRGNTISIIKRRHISLTQNNERHCVILLKGSISLCRISDGMVLNSENAPFIFGANIQLSYSRHLYAKAKETSTLLLIPQTELYEIVDRLNLWKSFAALQDYSAAKVYSHCLAVSQLSSYEIIRIHLLELIDEPESIRNNITAANYIMNHSFLSRSGIMRILAILKTEGYIHLSRGILTEVISLPEQLSLLYSKSKTE
ncbi:helix-turn-helix domain-containing protein [Citrobacter europaeus]|uniref:helix-turn-helix domain-containing protein n=1 Tax=Citrobacter europaeus TaxID=1914243 RepID=UPI000537750D|nr:helix-turn-helix domain-containing protein [Citrobacter europaeus]AUT97575.1 cyclic nucleotide-binding protein [Citrobacter freundii]ROW38568.1 cyclic nucleotide-binding protein [Citrobacter europaeus]